MENQQVTIDELAIMVKAGFDGVTKEFVVVKQDISGIKIDVASLKADVACLKDDVSGLKVDVGSLKNQMVTKDYLDEKLGKLKGDLVVMVRKEDQKVNVLAETLQNKDVLSAADLKSFRNIEVFPAPPTGL